MRTDGDASTGHSGRRRERGAYAQSVEVELHPAVIGVNQAVQALREGQLGVAYDFLPRQFQTDLDQIVQQGATTVDPALWEVVRRVGGKLRRVLDEKQPLIAQSWPPPEGDADRPGLSAETLAALSETLSVLPWDKWSDLAWWRKFDSRHLLETTGNDLWRKLHGPDGPGRDLALPTPDAVQVMSTDTRVFLLIARPGQDAADHVEFVDVDARWIPRALADGWPETMNGLRKRISLIDAAMQQRAIATLTEIEARLDQMLAAEDVAQFQAAAVPLVLAAIQTYQWWQQPPGPADGVSITIRGATSDEQQTLILADLEQLSDDPERCVYSAASSGDGMVISLRPVSDVERFAARLPFAAELKFDVGARTVSFQYRQP
jgi:hypothetical protein